MSAQSYLYELNLLDTEIKRLSEQLKLLRTRRTSLLSRIHITMKAEGLNKIGEGKKAITLEKCSPKQPRLKPKPKTERQQDAIVLFRNVGIPDPVTFYAEFQKTQKNNSTKTSIQSKDNSFDYGFNNTISVKNKKKNKKKHDGYDDLFKI